MTITTHDDIMRAILMCSGDHMDNPEFQIMVRNTCTDLMHIKNVYRFDWRDLGRIGTMLDMPYWTDMERRAITSVYRGLEVLCGHGDRDDRHLFMSAESLLTGLLASLVGSLSVSDEEFLGRVAEQRSGVFHLKDGMTAERLVDIADEVYCGCVKVRL